MTATTKPLTISVSVGPDTSTDHVVTNLTVKHDAETDTYTVRATIDGHRTTWSALLQASGKLGATGWESSDQWIDIKTVDRLGFDHALALGIELLAHAEVAQ